MPALGKVGPRPGCLRGAFSSGRTGWLGRESGCGGGRRGGEKVLPQGLEGARVSTAGAAPLRGGPTARAATDSARSSPPPPTAAVASGEELRRLLPGAAGQGWTHRARGEGARVSGAGRRCLWAPSPERLVRGRAGGAVSSSPPGAPYELRPLPARHPGARARGLCHPVPRSNLAEAAASPEGLGRGWQPREELLPSAGSAVPLVAAGFARRRDPPRPPLPGRTRGEERTHAGSWRPLAWRAPWPPRLAALTLAAGRSRGASARVASLPARACPECGVVIVTLRSGGASRRSCSGCGSRCPRLGRAGCRPGGALTSPPCSAPVPPPPLHFLCLWSPLVAREGRMRGRTPRFLPGGPSSASPPSPPPRRVCTTAEARRANAGSPGPGVEIKQTMTFPFPALLSQVRTHLKNASVVSDPCSPPRPIPGSEFKCPVPGFLL